MPKFVVYYSYDLKDREDNYMAGDKNTFIIEVDDRRLIDGKEIIAKVRRIAQDHCKKGWVVSLAMATVAMPAINKAINCFIKVASKVIKG